MLVEMSDLSTLYLVWIKEIVYYCKVQVEYYMLFEVYLVKISLLIYTLLKSYRNYDGEKEI